MNFGGEDGRSDAGDSHGVATELPGSHCGADSGSRFPRTEHSMFGKQDMEGKDPVGDDRFGTSFLLSGAIGTSYTV